MNNNIYEGVIRDEMTKASKHSKALIREFSIELFNTIREGLLEDGHVRLHQFGSFKLKWSEQRKGRSEEHTSELQSHHDLVYRLLLEKKKRATSTGLRHYVDEV